MSSKSSNTPSPLPTDTGASDDSLARVFGDPDLVRSTSDDPVLKFISSWWRQVTVAALAALAIFYATNVFRESRQRDLQASGDAFFKLQQEFEEYRTTGAQISELNSRAEIKTDEKLQKERDELQQNREQTRKKLELGFQALADTRAPFDSLAKTYQALLAKEGGDLTPLANLATQGKWSEQTGTELSTRFISELQALTYARALLDDSAKRSEALSMLKDLATRGEFTHTVAAITVAGVATSAEERTAAKELLTTVQQRFPEQSSLIEPELSKLQ